MTSIDFVDVSSFQGELTSGNRHEYTDHFISMRIGDGSYADPHFQTNFANAFFLINDSRTLAGVLAYVVYRPGQVDATIAMMDRQLHGNWSHTHLAFEIDVESWGGEIRGNHMAEINELRMKIVAKLNASRRKVYRKVLHGRDVRRVGIYGNAYDLAAIAPGFHQHFPWTHLANYSADPAFPGKIIRQYSCTGHVEPFGSPVDLNRTAGKTARELCAAMGIPVRSDWRKAKVVKKVAAKPTPKPAPKPAPKPEPKKDDRLTYEVRDGDNMTTIAAHHGMTLQRLEKLNPQVKNPGEIEVGEKLYLT